MNALRHLHVESWHHNVVVLLEHKRHVPELDAPRVAMRGKSHTVARSRLDQVVEDFAEELRISMETRV